MAIWTWQKFEEVAAERGDAVAVFSGADVLTFRQVKQHAEALCSTLSLAPGDRVVISGDNSPAIIVLVAAVWRAGGIVCMVHSDAPARHLLHATKMTSPRALYCDDPARTEGLEAQPVPALADRSAHVPDPAEVSGESPASIVFTSGSSGLPKGVTQSAQNLVEGAARVCRALGITQSDSVLCPIPFAFDYGWGQVMSLLFEGITLVLPSPRNSFGLCEALEAHRPTVLAGVPAVFGDLLSGLSPIRDTDRDCIRLISNTGSKIPDAVWSQLLEVFPTADVSLNYGLTETYRSATLPVQLAREHPDSVGRAIEGVTLSILRDDGNEAAPGEVGEIVHLGAGAFLGYWNDEEATARTLRRLAGATGTEQTAVFTGDLGWYDDEGLLYIHGRRDSQLKSMGVRVSPDEVEQILHESGLVTEVAITSRPHDILGDMIVACIVPRDSEEPRQILKDIKAFARSNMSNFMQPRQYVVMESLPRTPSGKVAYDALTLSVQAGD